MRVQNSSTVPPICSGNGHRRIVAAGQHQAVEHVVQRQRFTRAEIDARSRHTEGTFAGRYQLILSAVFQRQQRRHDFCGGRHGALCLSVVGQQNRSVLRLHDNGGGRSAVHLLRCGPSRPEAQENRHRAQQLHGGSAQAFLPHAYPSPCVSVGFLSLSKICFMSSTTPGSSSTMRSATVSG